MKYFEVTVERVCVDRGTIFIFADSIEEATHKACNEKFAEVEFKPHAVTDVEAIFCEEVIHA